MFKDILEESWAYQKILREGLEEGREQGMEEGIKEGIKEGVKQGRREERDANLKMWRESLITFTDTHFPVLSSLVKKQVRAIEDPLVLQGVMVSLFSAKSVEEARKSLLALGHGNDMKRE